MGEEVGKECVWKGKGKKRGRGLNVLGSWSCACAAAGKMVTAPADIIVIHVWHCVSL
jgi:hypothetical protein